MFDVSAIEHSDLSHMWDFSTWNVAKGTRQLDFQFLDDFGQGGFRFLQYHGVKPSSCTFCYRETVRNTIYWTSPSTWGTKLYILTTSASLTCTLKFVKLCLKWPGKIGVISQRCLGYSAIATSAASNWLNIFFSFTNASCPSWVRVNFIQYHSASGAQVSSVALRSFFFAITEEKADSLGKLVISTYVLVGKWGLMAIAKSKRVRKYIFFYHASGDGETEYWMNLFDEKN